MKKTILTLVFTIVLVICFGQYFKPKEADTTDSKLCALFDKKGNQLSPYEYEEFTAYMKTPKTKTHAMVKKNGKWGYVNSKGEEFIECKYEKAYFFEYNKAKVILNGKELIIDWYGNKIDE